MLMGCSFSGIGIACGDGLDDLVMVAPQSVGAGRADDMVEVQVQQALADPA